MCWSQNSVIKNASLFRTLQIHTFEIVYSSIRTTLLGAVSSFPALSPSDQQVSGGPGPPEWQGGPRSAEGMWLQQPKPGAWCPRRGPSGKCLRSLLRVGRGEQTSRFYSDFPSVVLGLFLMRHSWFMMLISTVQERGIHTYYTYVFTLFSIMVITGCWIEFPVLYGRTMLYLNSLHLLIPNSQSIPLPTWQQVCSLWICFCFIDKFISVLYRFCI